MQSPDYYWEAGSSKVEDKLVSLLPIRCKTSKPDKGKVKAVSHLDLGHGFDLATEQLLYIHLTALFRDDVFNTYILQYGSW